MRVNGADLQLAEIPEGADGTPRTIATARDPFDK